MELSDYVKKDKFHSLTLRFPDGEMEELGVNAKWDRVDHFPHIGAWILKLVTDDGALNIAVGETEARKVAREARLPIVERDFIYESEHETVIAAKADTIQESEFGLDDLGF